MNRKFFRCTACGAVFDGDVDICPVCGAGSERFEEVDPGKVAYRNNTGDMYLILGGGVAAVSAAEAIRARDNTGNIAILTDEPAAPYNRPMLTKRLSDKSPPMFVRKPEWYPANRVQLYTGMRIRSLDAPSRHVVLDDGTTFRYDKCVYAMGAECFVPPIPGADGANCATIRRLADVERIERMLATAKTAAVIGGGVLGLESAWALRKRGLGVAVIEVEERLMPRQLDEDASRRLKKAAEESGVRILTGAKTAEITPESVLLADGTAVPADIAILSCGIRANAAVAKDAELGVARAVVVDEFMRTSDESVFACGDCAEFKGVDMGLWPEAAEQGRIAGANASGDDLRYAPERYPVSFIGFGIRIFDGKIQ
ncbi:MAG: FAD-dependent oxidoreductase [Clostridiales bacterium]|jgi:NAD(P)H-nitrite reductase large subunit|nr:FAD-dependent oxidoreductase [Clostridiales bacterium]